MIILEIDKYYYQKSGATRHQFEVSKLLENHGHAIVPFSVRDQQNVKSQYARYFVSPVSTGKVSFGFGAIKTAGRMLYSFEARSQMSRLVREACPDIAHVHTIYTQISPSIFAPLRDAGIPIVITVHDYHLVAPNYMLFSHGKIEDWSRAGIFRATISKFHKDSYVASFMQSLAFNIHKKFGLYSDAIDAYICPSEFIKNKMVYAGYDPEKMRVIPHFIDAESIRPMYAAGNYALYFGRLSEEKGIDVLIEAGKRNKNIKIIIAGTGAYESRLRKLAKNAANIEFVGFKDSDELWNLVRGARFVVVPSVWYEVFGLSALEAMAHGKPVIASKIGGLPEVVKNNKNGLLFEAGSVKDLESRMKLLWNDPALCEKLGREGRRDAMENYNPEDYYKKLIQVFDAVRKPYV
ncbi:MAG: hypothetical protein ACD_76C00032G0002 [uncultured bacterium]|nr:MAG: hypothetical protein ACD_76C00032G0002 [uncultured bacterium]HBD05146.1 hypothetical protein [Candidatus Uhrbacteria bacterium]